MATELLACISLTRWSYDQLLEPACGHYGITRVELDTLLLLYNHPGHDTTTDTVKIRHPTKSHVSSFIKTLEEQGYLEKSYQGSNGKTIHLKVANKAVEILVGGLKIQKAFPNLVSQNFSDGQTANMEKNLK